MKPYVRRHLCQRAFSNVLACFPSDKTVHVVFFCLFLSFNQKQKYFPVSNGIAMKINGELISY